MAAATPIYPREPDMILTCDDQVFKLHSRIAGEQSVFFAEKFASRDETTTVCKIDLKEKYDDINADCDTVARVIYYLYHGDYGFATKYPTRPATASDAEPGAQESGSVEIQEEAAAIRSGSLALEDALITHAQMHSAAADFGVPGLTALSKEKFTSSLDLYPAHASGFTDLAEVVLEVYRNAARCDNDDLKTLLIAACLRDADRLQHDDELDDFVSPLSGIREADDHFPGFARDFIQDALGALVKSRERVVFLEGVLTSKKKVAEWMGGVKDGTPEVEGS